MILDVVCVGETVVGVEIFTVGVEDGSEVNVVMGDEVVE